MPSDREAACEYESQGLAAVLAAPGEGRDLRVLDLGAAAGSSLRVYARVARVVRFADLARELAVVPPGGAALSQGTLARLLPEGDHPWDVGLTWDLLGRLSRDGCAALMAHLAARGASGMKLLVVEVTSPELAGIPLRFVLGGGATVRCLPLASGARGGPDLAPAEVARRLAPFTVEHSFLLRSGIREYVAVLA